MESVLDIEKNASSCDLDELLTFVGLPSKRSARELSGSSDELFRGITSVLNNLLLRAIDKQTAPEFIAARDEVFGDFFKTMRAMSNLARVLIPRGTLERMSWESFGELEDDLTEQGLERFGAAGRDQAIFTVCAFRRMNRLVAKVASLGAPPKESVAGDREIANNFSFYAAWTQFHLECLVASMRSDKPIPPEVLEIICEGLRSAVNAYGFLRQGLELRESSSIAPPQAPYDWDEEDQELLDSSMSDMDDAEFEEY